jgi:hypothetical protein
MNPINYFRIIAFLTAFLFTNFSSYGQQDILKVAYTLNKLTGKVDVYYPDGFKEHALYTQDILEKALNFYKVNLNIDIRISVAMFGPKEYQAVTNLKWGRSGLYNQFLPFVAAGPPAIMCLPCAEGSALDSMVHAAVKQSKALQSFGISPDEISRRFITLVGIHELSHVIEDEIEIEQEVGWYIEFMANYIAYSFIQQMPPEKKMSDLINDFFYTKLNPTEKHFGGMFNGTSDNYVWWQSSLQKRIDEMFSMTGITFINQLVNLRNSQQYFDDLYMLVAMDNISPGFLTWAKKDGHINEQDKEKIQRIDKSIKTKVDEALKGRSHLFTSTYSAQWTKGDSANTEVVMKFMNSWENNSIDTSLLSLWVYFKNDYEKKEILLDKLRMERNNFAKWKISVSSIIPVKSIDREENWVIVYGTVNKRDLKDNMSAINFTQWYKVNKENRIEFFKEFDE